MTTLFNGVLKDKFKFPIVSDSQEAVADGALKDDWEPNKKEYDCEPDPSMLPMPTELLRHELDRDTVLQDTILSLMDKDGVPLRWKYLADDFDDVVNLLDGEDFFDNMPMPDVYRYHVARDWVGCPISKHELEAYEVRRKAYEKIAFDKLRELKQRRIKGKKLQEESFRIIREHKTLDF